LGSTCLASDISTLGYHCRAMEPDQSLRVATMAAAALLVAAPAYAYVDPGAGGMLMQLLLGGVMAGLVLFRSGWRRVIGWLQRNARPANGDPHN